MISDTSMLLATKLSLIPFFFKYTKNLLKTFLGTLPMAHKFQVIDPASHRTAMAFQGFSWTCLFFGPFPALFRGHIVGFIIMFVVNVFTLGISLLVFPFIYNKMHYNWLVGRGFRLAGAMGMHNQNVINVSVGNVGSADHSRNAGFALDPALQTPNDQKAISNR